MHSLAGISEFRLCMKDAQGMWAYLIKVQVACLILLLGGVPCVSVAAATRSQNAPLCLCRPPALSGSPVISDISLIRLSPHPAGPGESPFNAPHPYVSPHMEHYLRAVHSSPTLPTISAARGLSPADGE